MAYLVRIGLADGFRAYELPALGCALALLVSFLFLGVPVGLAASLIVASLVLGRAGTRRPDASPSLAPARA